MKSISIIIPNFNGRHLLEANLPSVLSALEHSAANDHEIIIPDDASVDDSAAFLKANYPGIILVEATINKGFAGNVNRGLAKASKDLVLILNSDVKLTENYFSTLLPYFTDNECFGVMGKIADPESLHIQDGAKYPECRFARINGTKNYLIEGQSKLFTLFLSGANALVCRKKMLEIGGFNELYNPFYYEDVDLGLRAWRAGFTLYYEHTAECYHATSSTIGKEKPSSVKTIALRNKIMLHYLHLPAFAWTYHFFTVAVKSLVYLCFFKPMYLKSLSKFLYLYPKIRSYKNNEQAKWKLTLKGVIMRMKKDIANENLKFF